MLAYSAQFVIRMSCGQDINVLELRTEAFESTLFQLLARKPRLAYGFAIQF